ncbi:MAG TPA: POTRA domain-containing protein, partial [Labilithrix sp.]|nr:POTRA domain-containing protein [Labilithrix sp.]
MPQGRTVVDELSIVGAKKVDPGDIVEKIATTASPKFLGLFRGVVYEYSSFDQNVLQRDLARVEAFYRSKGYYDARVRAGRVFPTGEHHVRVEIVVEEGEPVLVRDVHLRGLETLPQEVAAMARRTASDVLRAGAHFEEEEFDRARNAIRRLLADRGHAYAKVEHAAFVDIVKRKVDVELVVTSGPKCVFGPVTFEGLGALPEAPVRRALDITTGAPFSDSVLETAQQALLDLGVFASVEMSPELPEPPPPDRVVPIRVKVAPSRLRSIRLGGGIEFDAVKTDIHGSFGWEHKNFLGTLRTFAIHFKPGLVLYPLRVNNIELPNRFFPEQQLRLELRQPGLVEARTSGFIRPEVNVKALLLDPNPPPNAKVIGYVEARNGIGFDRAYRRIFLAISHNLQVAYPFAYVGSRDPTLGTLVISHPELVTTLDLRDDRVHPRRGIYLLNTLQVAGGPFGGQADDVKVQPDLRG